MRLRIGLCVGLVVLLLVPGPAQAQAPSWVNEGTWIAYEYTLWDANGSVEQVSRTNVTLTSLAGGHMIIVQESSPGMGADGVYGVHLETREITESSLGAGGYYPLWLPMVEPGEQIENQSIPCLVLEQDTAEPDYIDLECEMNVDTEDGPLTVEGSYRYGRESRLMFMSDLTVVGQSRETLVALETHFAAPGQLQDVALNGVSSWGFLGVTVAWVALAAGVALLIRRTQGWSPVRVAAGFCTECGDQRTPGFSYCVECGTHLGKGGS